MHSGAYLRHAVRVEQDYAEVPSITIDKHKVLQILVNLFQNAKYACDESGRADKQVTVRIARSGDDRVKIEVAGSSVPTTASPSKYVNRTRSTRTRRSPGLRASIVRRASRPSP
jgi:C4-dicarboxylate-specific signal transduction histidine kinase